MPKMKTDRGAAKRVKVTGTGRLRRRKAEPLAHPREEEQPAQAPARQRDRLLEGRRASCQEDARALSPGGSSGRHPPTDHETPRERSSCNGSSKARRPRPQAPPRRHGAGEGVLRQQEPDVPRRQRAAHALDAVRLPRPPGSQRRLPQALDPADQRRGPAERHELQPVHRRPPPGRRRGRPQGPRRPRGLRRRRRSPRSSPSPKPRSRPPATPRPPRLPPEAGVLAPARPAAPPAARQAGDPLG